MGVGVGGKFWQWNKTVLELNVGLILSNIVFKIQQQFEVST